MLTRIITRTKLPRNILPIIARSLSARLIYVLTSYAVYSSFYLGSVEKGRRGCLLYVAPFERCSLVRSTSLANVL